ncbi:MAG: FAD-dependent monooxygenase [Thermodesulfovibrionales bacterium]|nr:FAD-dependent monooxygenase [Thermodesulfovibrionales bacterium]
MLRTKVLVIGGGPAGSTAARFLAKEGIGTILLERNFSFVKPCGGGIPEAEGISAGTGSSDPGELKGMLKAFLGRRGMGADYTAARMYKVPLWSGELYNKDNILFIGDAAGQVMPLTYEGIYYAMKAGEFAAMAIIAGKPSDYKKLWRKRFNSRFMIMRKLCDYFLRDDNSDEKLISFYRRQEIQAATKRLWFEKSFDGRKLISFANFFRKVLN